VTKPTFEFTAAARVDLLRLWNYLAEQSTVSVADGVIAEIEAGIHKVAKTKSLGHRRPDLTDRNLFFYRVQSYLVVYRADKKPIHIIRILHGARDVKSVLRE
jgi:toxin ParE1/3/4